MLWDHTVGTGLMQLPVLPNVPLHTSVRNVKMLLAAYMVHACLAVGFGSAPGGSFGRLEAHLELPAHRSKDDNRRP